MCAQHTHAHQGTHRQHIGFRLNALLILIFYVYISVDRRINKPMRTVNGLTSSLHQFFYLTAAAAAAAAALPLPLVLLIHFGFGRMLSLDDVLGSFKHIFCWICWNNRPKSKEPLIIAISQRWIRLNELWTDIKYIHSYSARRTQHTHTHHTYVRENYILYVRLSCRLNLNQAKIYFKLDDTAEPSIQPSC